LSLNQIHNAIGHAVRLGVQQHALLAVQCADHRKLVPPIGLQARKHCTRGDQGIDGIKISLQAVKLSAYGGFYFASLGLFCWLHSEKQHVLYHDHVWACVCEVFSVGCIDHQ
jgi:hypothetical protein